MNTCWSRFRCAAVVGCFANTGGSLSLIFGAIGGAVCLPFFACCSVVVFVSSRFRDDGCGGGPVPNEEEDKVVVCPKWGWWSFFLCRGGTPIVDCARPGRDCATRDFVELIVVLVAFVSVFVDISARIVPSTSFGFRATPRSDSFLTEKEAKETAKDHPAPEEEDDFFASPRRKPSSSSSSSSSSSAQQRARLDAGALLLLLFASGMKAVVPT